MPPKSGVLGTSHQEEALEHAFWTLAQPEYLKLLLLLPVPHSHTFIFSQGKLKEHNEGQNICFGWVCLAGINKLQT